MLVIEAQRAAVLEAHDHLHARDQAGGKDVVGDEPLTLAGQPRCELVEALTGPWRQRRVVQHPHGGTGRRPRRRRRLRRLAEAAQCRPADGRDREHGRLAPQDLRRRDRRQGHRLDLDAGPRLISIDLQEHVTDPQGRAPGWATTTPASSMPAIVTGMITDLTSFIARDCAVDSAPLPGGLVHATGR
jgi:hypothetical protein